MELDKKTMQRIMGLILFAGLVFVGLQHYEKVGSLLKLGWGILFPFILGAAIAFILNVPMQFLERHLFGRLKAKGNKKARKLARPISLVLSIFLVLGIIMVVVLVVAPELGKTFVSLGKNMERALPRLQAWGMELFHNNKQIVEWIQEIDMDWKGMLQDLVNMLTSGAGDVLSSTVTVTVGIFSAVTNFFISFVFACYILLQKEKLSLQVKKILYACFSVKHVERAIYVCSLSYRTFSKFITGQCIEAVILGTMFFVTMSIFKFPYALLVGILIAFTALIPIFGAFIGCFVGTFLILIVSPFKALMFLILFLVLQQVEGNLIYPKVVGSSVGLPSIWVLVAVTMGGSLMGVAGMLIFIPLMSIVYSLFREWVYARLKRREVVIK